MLGEHQVSRRPTLASREASSRTPALARGRKPKGFGPRWLGGSFLEEALPLYNHLVSRFLGKGNSIFELAVEAVFSV